MIGIFKGLSTTLSTALRKTVTIQYPDEKHVLPLRERSFPVLTWDFDHDEPFCTGCMVCVRNCPVECMTAVMQDNPKYLEGTSNRRKIIEKFWIDYGRCMRCNICIEVCNFEAIVMDNTWAGHEHSAYDRRDLHKDLADLLEPSKSGELTNPYRPQDDLEANEKAVAGEPLPEPSMKGARPEARIAQIARIEEGKPAAIQEREPEKPKVQAAAAAAGGPDAELAALSPSKLRAKRMRAEREAREKAVAAGEDPEAAAAAVRAQFDAAASGAPAPAAAAAAAPAGGTQGDPNSPSKVRARRMRAEREARAAAIAAGEDPEAAAAAAAARFEAEQGGAAAPAATAAPAAAPAGAGGDPNSANKLRARRMREERQAREAAIAAGEDPEAAVAEVRKKWGLE
jgi:NADH-quinone oxidoreductase subunit I